MSASFNIGPVVGDWYASHGELFEVVAVDEDEGTVEVQYADGTLAEIDSDDWSLRSKAGALHPAEPPEDAHFSMDTDLDTDEGPRPLNGDFGDEAGLRASGLDELDLFE